MFIKVFQSDGYQLSKPVNLCIITQSAFLFFTVSISKERKDNNVCHPG